MPANVLWASELAGPETEDGNPLPLANPFTYRTNRRPVATRAATAARAGGPFVIRWHTRCDRSRWRFGPGSAAPVRRPLNNGQLSVLHHQDPTRMQSGRVAEE